MRNFALAIFALFTFLTVGCSKKSEKSENRRITVFVPGICDDSPTYAMLVQGVKKAVGEYNDTTSTTPNKIDLFVMEAGTNQAEWGQKITALAAENKYDVIISSNPSLPDLVEPILQKFPNQKFILLDASKKGNPNIYTVCYNQYEAAYLTGYIGGLMSKNHKMGLIAAQEYPVMNNIIYPYFEKGGKAANSQTTVDFRVVGNWYDATKGAEIADALYKKGIDVLLPICGGAAQGVISSAVNNEIYVTWFDSKGFEKAPGRIISSCTMEQALMAEKVTRDFLDGKTPWGQADMVGVKDGFVKFIDDDENYIKTVPADVREKMSDLVEKIKNGEFSVK